MRTYLIYNPDKGFKTLQGFSWNTKLATRFTSKEIAESKCEVGERSIGLIDREAIASRYNLEYRIEVESNSSQRVIGTYCLNGYSEKEVKKDIEDIVAGTFGGMFLKFENGEFIYSAFTD